jgi:uncharacterized protein YbgA (DUF1722 family)/uncharacterized protein YbbK (DUF523 family)
LFIRTITLGISSCLLGNSVRYDGGHRANHYLINAVGKYIQWHPVCPEVECGLTVPREPMVLIGRAGFPRLVTVNTGIDHTERLKGWVETKIEEIGHLGLCGFVLKNRSPSCGIRDVNVFDELRGIVTFGSGLFVRALRDKFPLMPIEDEEGLLDLLHREGFFRRIFVYARWQCLNSGGLDRAGLMDFHTSHKLLMMAHSPEHYRKLGSLMAGQKGYSLRELAEAYISLMTEGLLRPATVNRHVNVLQHIAGYFKDSLSLQDKGHLLMLIGQYQRGEVALIEPLLVLRQYAERFDKKYLLQQVYLDPLPIKMALGQDV